MITARAVISSEVAVVNFYFKYVENLDNPRVSAYSENLKNFSGRDSSIMFKDLFDFSKQRTIKESVGFFLFYGGIIMGVYATLSVLGIA